MAFGYLVVVIVYKMSLLHSQDVLINPRIEHTVHLMKSFRELSKIIENTL